MTDPQPDQGQRPRWLPFSEMLTKWSMWVAAFWGAIGAVIMVLSAYLYNTFDWSVGILVIFISATFAVARWAKQPGTEQ